MGPFALALLLALACARCASGTDADIIAEFEQWFAQKGGRHASFQLTPTDTFRRWSVVATQDIREGDVLFQIPLSATMCGGVACVRAGLATG